MTAYKKQSTHTWKMTNDVVQSMVIVGGVGGFYYVTRQTPVFTSFYPILPYINRTEQRIMGGMLIGLSAALMMLLRGKILGNETILNYYF